MSGCLGVFAIRSVAKKAKPGPEPKILQQRTEVQTARENQLKLKTAIINPAVSFG